MTYERSSLEIRDICEGTCEESPAPLATVTSGCLLRCSPALLRNDITVLLPHIPPPDFEISGKSALCWAKETCFKKEKKERKKNTCQHCRMQRQEHGEKQEITVGEGRGILKT